MSLLKCIMAKQPEPAAALQSIWPLFLLLLLTSTTCGSGGGLASAAGPIVATFSEPATSNGGHRLQHLVVDKHSALVYVGGVNRLYQLSPELERQVTVETGPREDSPECPAVDCLGSVVKRPTDNVNKALVIDYTDTRLIACGTLYQGTSNNSFFLSFFIKLHFCFNRNMQREEPEEH